MEVGHHNLKSASQTINVCCYWFICNLQYNTNIYLQELFLTDEIPASSTQLELVFSGLIKYTYLSTVCQITDEMFSVCLFQL